MDQAWGENGSERSVVTAAKCPLGAAAGHFPPSFFTPSSVICELNQSGRKLYNVQIIAVRRSGRKMNNVTRRLASMSALIVLGAPVFAQAADAPPDFSGIWRRDFQIQNLLDPPESGPGRISQDPRYPKTDSDGVPRRRLTEEELEQVITFTNAWIPDPSSSILQPETRAALELIREQELEGIPHPEMQTLCKPTGVPHIVDILNNTRILQTPTEVIFLYERDHQVRRVYLNVPHSDDPGHSWYGESVGHYEGNTLVVDTIGQNDLTHVDRFATPHSDRIHVVERYWLSDGGRTLEAEVFVEDPVAFTVPWSGRATYRSVEGWSETVCAENNEREYWPGHPLPISVDHTPDF